MPTASTVRRITPERQRNFGKIYDVHPVPDLTEIQTRSYERFLQADLTPEERADAGLEGVFREIFPIESYDKTLKLEYIKFDLGKPRYEPDECRQLRLEPGEGILEALDRGEVVVLEHFPGCLVSHVGPPLVLVGSDSANRPIGSMG